MDSNVAVIHIGRLLDESKRGKVLSETLRSQADKWQTQIGGLQQKITEGRAKLEKLGDDAPAEARFKLARETRMQELELNHLQQKARVDLESRRDAARTRVLQELQPLLTALAEERKLAMVLAVPSREVAYAAPAIDLTDELLGRYDSGS